MYHGNGPYSGVDEASEKLLSNRKQIHRKHCTQITDSSSTCGVSGILGAGGKEGGAGGAGGGGGLYRASAWRKNTSFPLLPTDWKMKITTENLRGWFLARRKSPAINWSDVVARKGAQVAASLLWFIFSVPRRVGVGEDCRRDKLCIGAMVNIIRMNYLPVRVTAVKSMKYCVQQ